ncbi:MAG: type II secretion system major pseudopilin GspG [Nevskiaceae bacterium]|jgi:general secretion pathway protein G|nr:type II secretion system major pseudopilin GspG [Nevskiaceae bacterium]
MTFAMVRRQRGFTLIEIMVVVIIIGLLAAIIGPQVLGRVDDAKITKAHSDIRAIESGLTLYKLDNYRFPSTAQGLRALVEKPADPNVRNWKDGGYLKRLQQDPWGNDYQYASPGEHGEFDIYSLGADGQPGGEGVDADIGNWSLEQ